MSVRETEARLTRVVVATRNQHKLVELRRMLACTGVELLSLDEVAPDAGELREEEDSFRGNALSKARQAYALSGLPALADDSGLEVDALDGAPGVYSARYAGEQSDSAANRAKLLASLKAIPEERRGARFRCVIALVEAVGSEDGELLERTFDGSCEGMIALEPAGSGGFGYDPLFFLPDRQLTVAQISDAEKDEISHRGRAVAALSDYLAARGRARTS